MPGPTIRDKFKELKSKAEDLVRRKNVFEGKLEEKRNAREDCLRDLKELGIKNPSMKTVKEFIDKKKKELVSKIKTKMKEVDDACDRLEQLE